ncbi:MAG: TlpA disulfide reductase family protein [Candidatus Kapaibacterium sp.]
MKILNFIIAFAVLFVISSCGKKEEAPKTEQKKTETTQQQNTSTNTSTSSSQIYKISAVEESKSEKMLPNVTWEENGKKVSLADQKGKVLLINFWATWCAPCKKEMPDLSLINTELKDKDFKMYGINVFFKGTPTIETVLQQIPITYPILDGNDEVVAAFEKAMGSKMEGVPTTLIIDKNGKIVDTMVGMRDKETFMSSIKKYL